MASSPWEEVLAVQNEGKHELSLQGSYVNTRIEASGLDPCIFKLTGLNLLKIAGTPIETISDDLENVKNLTSLMLENNKLKCLPDSLGKLTSLKFLDISGNRLETLPHTLSHLVNLQSLNANLNQLTSFPDVSNFKQLAYLYISKNKLTSLPEGICDPGLTLLSIIEAGDNEITTLPAEVSNLTHLIKLDVSSNKLSTLPYELSECPKLKELAIKGNNLKDRKLLKLAEHSTKALLNHLGTLLDKERAAAGGGGGKGKKDKKKKGRGNKSEKPEIERDVISVLQFEPDKGLVITAAAEVLAVRQYIVCAIMRNLDFGKSNNLYKRFIQLQTRLHENICEKRQKATIATHDLKLIKGPLLYTAAEPSKMELTPLNKAASTTAEALVKELRDEADALRKEKKRNTFSGIHKYLDLLKGKELYPCLKDLEDDVISFPPITNCEKTRINKLTQDILVEVTSSESLETCKKVMEETLMASLLLGIGSGDEGDAEKAEEAHAEAENEAEATGLAAAPVDTSRMRFPQKLTVEQVKVVDATGNLRVIYPSRVDLQNPAFDVVRNYE
ncbi:leucine-rich repeat-containing protein 47-like [Plakobranchus ocellatus]|uniref:Leucine-rich repeat-containing protein 47-like n=1 Tax=Plakobranchus ocellatus TaxID=259542 RepID=A0AAV3Y1C0_9GAST|nr:leucine-rich repeat-containing protein 47-like [Plakobranchus ocellatus]